MPLCLSRGRGVAPARRRLYSISARAIHALLRRLARGAKAAIRAACRRVRHLDARLACPAAIAARTTVARRAAFAERASRNGEPVAWRRWVKLIHGARVHGRAFWRRRGSRLDIGTAPAEQDEQRDRRDARCYRGAGVVCHVDFLFADQSAAGGGGCSHVPQSHTPKKTRPATAPVHAMPLSLGSCTHACRMHVDAEHVSTKQSLSVVQAVAGRATHAAASAAPPSRGSLCTSGPQALLTRSASTAQMVMGRRMRLFLGG